MRRRQSRLRKGASASTSTPYPFRPETAPTARSCIGVPVPVARVAGSVPGSATRIFFGGTAKSKASVRAIAGLVTIT